MLHGIVATLISYATLLYFYMPWLWDKSVQILESFGLDETHEIKITILFFLLDSIKDTVLGLPWSLYSTFVIEERHGFNKQTLGLFFMDMLKQVGCSFLQQNFVRLQTSGGPLCFICLLICMFKVRDQACFITGGMRPSALLDV